MKILEKKMKFKNAIHVAASMSIGYSKVLRIIKRPFDYIER